ncbi:pyrroloquinoline quinone precursor peptide PqqA [Lysobacter enzymogenes]|uniref:pyrroloquinoline quinone precursor peptide PqqA n=1 Tax=Lysobacter enzymogenes TaxID=69 RepID=UPI00099B55EB
MQGACRHAARLARASAAERRARPRTPSHAHCAIAITAAPRTPARNPHPRRTTRASVARFASVPVSNHRPRGAGRCIVVRSRPHAATASTIRAVRPLSTPSPARGTLMKTWSKPQIREIPCGCEINSYSSGDLF